MSAPLLLTRQEAADTLRMSLRHFERHVQPHVRIIVVGKRRLVSVRELERWIEAREQLGSTKAGATPGRRG